MNDTFDILPFSSHSQLTLFVLKLVYSPSTGMRLSSIAWMRSALLSHIDMSTFNEFDIRQSSSRGLDCSIARTAAPPTSGKRSSTEGSEAHRTPKASTSLASSCGRRRPSGGSMQTDDTMLSRYSTTRLPLCVRAAEGSVQNDSNDSMTFRKTPWKTYVLAVAGGSCCGAQEADRRNPAGTTRVVGYRPERAQGLWL